MVLRKKNLPWGSYGYLGTNTPLGMLSLYTFCKFDMKRLYLKPPGKKSQQLIQFEMLVHYLKIIYVWIYENEAKGLTSRTKRAFFSRQKLSQKGSI